MGQKKGLTQEQHKAMGAELHAIHDQLITIAVLLGNSYRLDSKTARLAETVLHRVDQLRSELENRAFEEHPRTQDWIRVYYPGKTAVLGRL